MFRFLPHLRRRHAELDARVADARKRADDAAGEARKSQARQEAVRERVVMPLQRAAAHNQFAQMIRDSLTEGQREQ